MMDSTATLGPINVPEQVQEALLKRIDTGDIELPLLPDVVWQVMDMSSSDDADARQLSELIHRDQALAGHILRVANSPAYMPRTPIVSLQQAISRLGLTQLSEIAFAVSLQTRVFEAPGYAQEVRILWEHAVGAAAYASEIARMRRRNVEGAFLCGLLHDIGKPVTLQLLIDVEKEVGYTLEAATVAAVMEAHHTRVGGLLATQWALPPHVHESILFHHDPLVAPTCVEAVMVTRLADHLSYHMMLPDIYDEESVYHNSVLTELNLYPEDAGSLLAMRDKIQGMIEAMT